MRGWSLLVSFEQSRLPLWCPLTSHVDRACCMLQIFWSKKRRWVFFLFTIAVFLVNLAVIANFSMHFKTHVMPPIYRYVFLGYNFLYNTQVRLNYESDLLVMPESTGCVLFDPINCLVESLLADACQSA